MYNDLGTLEEAIRQKVKESKKDTMKIEDVHTDEEDMGVSISQEKSNVRPIHLTTSKAPVLQQVKDYPKICKTLVKLLILIHKSKKFKNNFNNHLRPKHW